MQKIRVLCVDDSALVRGLMTEIINSQPDMTVVATAPNLESADATPLRAASERYGADALLAVHARQEGNQWQAKWRLWLGDKSEQGTAQGADTGAVADAVMLAVSQKLAPRFAVKPGVSTEQLLEVQGMTLERYAALGHLLEPFGGQPLLVDGNRIVYRVNGSADQLRTQLSLAKLQEVPAGEAPAQQPAVDGTQPAPAPEPQAQLRFRW
jgi:hypothetical protein